jgi:predicted anti-sigma-YlaC factor YlaD
MSEDRIYPKSECRAIVEQLSEYLDGELKQELCSEFEGHVGNCKPCQSFLDTLRNTVQLTATAPSPTMSDEIRRDIKRAYERLKRERAGGQGK